MSAFLDICDELVYQDPSSTISVAQTAPAYADRVFADDAGGESFHLRAWATYGSARVVVGCYDEAELLYERAASFGGDADEHASLDCRVARLRCEQQRWQEALAAVEGAVRHFEKRYDPNALGRETDRLSYASALVTRANVHVLGYFYESGDLRSAAQDLKIALSVCCKTTERARLSALQSLGYVAAAAWIGGEPAVLNPSQVVELMRQVRRSLQRQRIRHCSVVHAKTRWVMGLALAQESMGLTRRAENYLLGALEDLITLKSYPEAAMITLDLGWWLLQEGRWPKLRALVAQLVAAPWARRFPTEWRTALEIWRRSVQEEVLDQDALTEVYRTIRGIRLRFPVDEAPRRWSTSIGW